MDSIPFNRRRNKSLVIASTAPNTWKPTTDAKNVLPLQGRDGRDDGVAETVAEAHDHGHAPQGTVQEPLDDDHPFTAHPLSDARDESRDGASAIRGVPEEAGWMEDLDGEVAAEHAPERAVRGGRDRVLVVGKNPGGVIGRRPGGEGRAALHQDAARHRSVGDEDDRGGQEVDGEDRAVPGPGGADDEFNAKACPFACSAVGPGGSDGTANGVPVAGRREERRERARQKAMERE
jgi:hypothetical protein